MVTMRSSSVSASSTDMKFSEPDDDSEELEELDSDSEELVEEDVLVDSDDSDSDSDSVWDESDNCNMFTSCKISWMNVWRSETVGIKLQLYLIKHVDVLL